MKENYSPVLKMLGQRSPTDSDVLTWIALVLFLLPIVLLLGNYLRLYIQRRNNRARSYDQLEKLAGEKGLSYTEQVLVEDIADHASLNNPVQFLSSIETFDRAIATYMKYVEKMPWIEVDEKVNHIQSVRAKIGFRYLSAERPPTTTRELKIGQKVYSLAASPKGVKLIYADIFDLNDLAILTRPFRTAKNAVKLGKKNQIWGFFWSEGGGEYRFRTYPLKVVTKPTHYLLLKHGDDLYHNYNRQVFVCNQDLELVVEWVSTQNYGNNLSPNIFERVTDPETLALSIVQLTGSGLELSFDGRLEVDDLIRMKTSDNLPSFLEDIIVRVIKISAETISCRYLNMTDEKRHLLLTHIANHMTVDEFQRRLKVRRSAQKTT